MATSLLALLDDITSVLDDVAMLSKLAAKKTSGVLGDDLALNAKQVVGVQAHRELPVVWAVAKGSLKNKAVLVPAALLLSALAPWAVTPLLMAGGLYLCYEGVEKLAHKFLQPPVESNKEREVLLEKDKIAGAVRTDFVLSAEIIAITLPVAAGASFAVRAGVLTAVAVLMTVFVYGFVAGVVKLDDLGLRLGEKRHWAPLGRAILRLAPWLMKALSVVGTAAMFLVGGGILVHGLPLVAHAVHGLASAAGPLGFWVSAVADAAVGVVAGALTLAVTRAGARV